MKAATGLFLAVLLIFAMVGSAGATTVALTTTLDQLTPSGITTSDGNLDFSHFDSSMGLTAKGQIWVAGETPKPYGLVFYTAGNQNSGPWYAKGANQKTTSITFDVKAGANRDFTDAYLTVVESYSGGSPSVTETVSYYNGSGWTLIPTTLTNGSGPLSLAAYGDPNRLRITDTITVTGASGGGWADVASVANTFGEVRAPVPLPSALLLLAPGLLGLVGIRKRLKG